MEEQPLLAIVGPTAVGKSRLALHIAQALNGEIINADSRQIYRFMNIGTAKPSPKERSLRPHHLVDIRDPDENFSLAIFLELANLSIIETHERGGLPIIVGGTGQYVWALLEGWQIPKVEPNPNLRAGLEEKVKRDGSSSLYKMLENVDPDAAQKIDPNNARRIIRALEVYLSPASVKPGTRRKEPRRDPLFIIGLTMERKRLYQRIDARFDQMLAMGFLEEVKELLDLGYSLDSAAMSSVGYREMSLHIKGDLTLKEAIQRAKYRTHRIARQQYAWASLEDPRIHWVKGDGCELEAGLKLAQDFVRGCGRIIS